ncbi:MAG: CHAD domain-containing protein [bacterium]
MRHPPLHEPAGCAASDIALSLLDDACAAARAVADARRTRAHDAAVHDFRVALRRLRVWQRVFAPWLGRASSRGMQARLRDVAHATNASRDAAVRNRWFRQQKRSATLKQKPGMEWLIAHGGAVRNRNEKEAASGTRLFRDLAPELAKRLEHQRGKAKNTTDRFGAVAGALVHHGGETLRQRLSLVRGDADVQEAHAARIAAKQLRYLLEQIAPTDSNATPVVARLKGLQDLLGELHDAHMLVPVLEHAAKHATGPRVRGIDGLAARRERRQRRAFTEVEQKWLGRRAEPFFRKVRAFADDLTRHAPMGERPATTVSRRAPTRR